MEKKVCAQCQSLSLTVTADPLPLSVPQVKIESVQ